jgi:hypothetical protein
MYMRVAATIVAMVGTAMAGDSGDSRDSRDKCSVNTIPLQVRVAYSGTTGMAISWNTKQMLETPTVSFGVGPQLGRDASSHISVTYQTSSTYNNHVTLTDLTPDTTYHYRIMCDTRVFTFTTARRVGHRQPYSFAMVGDLGTMGPDGLSTTVGVGAKNPLKPGEKNTIESLFSMKPKYDFIWHSE